MIVVANEPTAAGITQVERWAVEALSRAVSEGNPGLLDEAVAPDWHDIPLAPGQQPGQVEDWFGWLNQVGAWPGPDRS